MKKKICYPVLILTLLLSFALAANAEMQSPNYRIPTSVLSGSGAPTASTNFQTNSTLGQPSPLMDPMEPPFSDSFDLYPGFWYVISALASTCPCDFDGDKDVDGADLVEYIFDSGGLSLDVFAANFGKTNCP